MNHFGIYKFIAVLITITVGVFGDTTTPPPLKAIAIINNGDIQGNVTFTQAECGQNMFIKVLISGLKPGSHGFHVHEKGDLSNGCLSMLGHFNPDKLDHGGPAHEVRHVGDLGNIEANSLGIVDITFTDNVTQLAGPKSIIGRGIVIHEDKDDLGLGGHNESKKTGNAGSRIACAVIGILDMYDNVTCVPPCTQSIGSGLNINSFVFLSIFTTIITSIIVNY